MKIIISKTIQKKWGFKIGNVIADVLLTKDVTKGRCIRITIQVPYRIIKIYIWKLMFSKTREI